MWSCPPVLCAGRDRARASGGRKKLKGATLTSSRVAPSDRAGPGWVPGWRLELADHLVAVRSWLLHQPQLGLAIVDGVRHWTGRRQRRNRPSRVRPEPPIAVRPSGTARHASRYRLRKSVAPSRLGERPLR